MLRRSGEGKSKGSSLVTVAEGDLEGDIDAKLQKEMSNYTLIHVFPVYGDIPVVASCKYELRCT